MTQDQKTELLYLIDLLRESTKWNVDQGDDAIRLEIDLRINTILNGEEPTDAEPDNLPEEDEALTCAEHLASPDKAAKAVNTWKSKRVRCQENGHPVWHLRSECVKEPRDNRNGGPAWTWKWIGPHDKKKQEDAMWAEHERS